MTIVQFILIGSILFSLGIYGVITRRNAVLVLASVELMLAGVNVNLVAFNVYLQDQILSGQIFTLFIIALAAAEVGIGIAIILMIFRNRQSADVDDLHLMKG
ncbi:MAG: NADH-quinone oxidoreductase subunit NuoK [Actinomycetota bacterium]|nr:NADH-quinone oxidoreductase subunit NuoK [Actinomycetota bacterium]MDK1017487.1 NADH-quinone oxidoreductase subunit NuoK [Actinomycetota bacterium]MDK1039318.1 NADH-quinone oxidoreductase subunit NuoK [Actinomycetota bacterium]MDK1097303.1 NADH-quinone oxidoreductase subunit NuoK [Actinomycetota bacterium]MDK1103658.1 NADH-quinone oxidoreductase subunit NuoK [Actinomycetota bacterium]